MKNGQRKLGQYLCKKWYSLAIPAVVLLCASFFMSAPNASALTTVPTKTNFQGRLTNSAGNIMPDGLYNMKFRLFTVDTGGVAVWNETRETTNRVQVTNGLFSVRLGDVTPIPASLFASGNLYFEIELPTPGTVNCSTAACGTFTEGPMTPRNQLATSAYAYNSETLDGFDSADFGKLIANNTWTGNNIFSGASNSFTGDTFSVNTNDNVDIISGADMFFDGGSITFGNFTTFSDGISAGHNALIYGGGVVAEVFGVQDGSAVNLFSVNKSTSIVRVGNPTADATGVVLVLDTKNSAGDPSAAVGGMYYNSNTGKFRCYQVSAWKECGLDTLQDSYTASTGGTTPEIKLDSTRGGLDIQDADTTIGAGGLLNVRASNGSGLGVALFSVGNTGVITAQNSVDSAAAFTISRAGAGGSLFVADTTSSRIQIGNAAADATGIVLVLDTKNNAGDPTGVDGAMYYNSSMRAFRCYMSGQWQSCGGLAFANTTVSNTVVNTTTETNFNQSYTIPADDCQPGKVYRVTARGVYGTQNWGLGAASNLTVRVKLGSTVIGATPAINPGANRVSRQWLLDFNFTCINASSSGSVEGQGGFQLFTTNIASTPVEVLNTAVVGSINFTTSQTLQVSAQWSTAYANSTVTLRQLVIEELGS